MSVTGLALRFAVVAAIAVAWDLVSQRCGWRHNDDFEAEWDHQARLHGRMLAAVVVLAISLVLAALGVTAGGYVALLALSFIVYRVYVDPVTRVWRYWRRRRRH